MLVVDFFQIRRQGRLGLGLDLLLHAVERSVFHSARKTEDISDLRQISYNSLGLVVGARVVLHYRPADTSWAL